MKGLFFTGTNTGVGKTYVAALVARALVAAGRNVGVYKPVASGCRRAGDTLVAEDAELLWQATGQNGDFERVCPQRFALAVAPPRSALAEGRRVDPELLRTGLDYWRERCEIVLVEGAGGLMSPLSDADYNIDLARDLGLPLVIVSANELGTINATLQTLITARAAAPELPMVGVVLNHPHGNADNSAATNAAELAVRCDVPLLATVGFQASQLPADVNWFALAANLRLAGDA
jgi:dethiobiotin synthetase